MSHHSSAWHAYTALINPETSVSIQKCHTYTSNLNSETPADSKNAFLHCGDVLGSGQEAKGHPGGLRPVLEGEQGGSQGDGREGEARQGPGAVHCQGKEQGMCTAVYKLWTGGYGVNRCTCIRYGLRAWC